ncbi:hypothetical protein SLEP1_g37188 [Rubroshorea leprosula]|uniref:Uncharacterized protein n=1 Tax=Rubroshorea leprosula TaxID=152421 RepID=A0AAV5KU22_9ROSI|nr:hypothetical protein SLEP1_g37188 [Rubroshorea leprosula]
MPESSTNSSVSGNSTSPSQGSSSESTPSDGEGIEEGVGSPSMVNVEEDVLVFEKWEDKIVNGRLSNICSAPQNMPIGFRFTVALHHEVVNGTTTVKGLEIPVKAIVFRSLFLCRLSSTQTRWYYISGREKMMLFKNIRNKVTRWKRQFIFVCDTQTERISNELANRISEWRSGQTYMNYPTLVPDNVDLKNRLLDYVKVEGLVDLEALVTPEQLAMFGFVDVANLYIEGEMSNVLGVNELNAHGVIGERATSIGKHASMNDQHCRLVTRHTKVRAPHRGWRATHSAENKLWGLARLTRHVKVVCRAFNYMVALFKCEQEAHEQTYELIESCKQLTSKKASLEDEVSRLQSSKMANIVALAESQADELANKVNALKEELEKAQAERESGIQAAKDKASCVKERAKKNFARVEDALNRTKVSHQCSVCIARAQRAKWLVRSNMFQDAMAVALMNTTTKIYNDICGKLKWKLNEDGVPTWPPSVLEEREDFKGLPRFDSWI